MVVATLALLLIEPRAVTHIVAELRHGGSVGDGERDSAVATSADQVPGDLPSAPSSSQPAADPTGSPEAQQLLAAISSAGTDLLPAASCGVQGQTVVCREPAPDVGDVVLTPFPTRDALYEAYADEVQRRSGTPAPANTGNCTGKQQEGEVSWNLDREHRDDLSVTEQVLGGLDPASEAAGRVFCTETGDVVQLVWTQDPGLLATATGQPSTLALAWWNEVHLRLACAAGGIGSGCEEEPSGAE